MTALFPLGRIVATPAALEALAGRMLGILARHASGDWGDLAPEDREANDRALRDGDRLLSRYDLGVPVYVVTEHDRSITTVMLTEEY